MHAQQTLQSLSDRSGGRLVNQGMPPAVDFAAAMDAAAISAAMRGRGECGGECGCEAGDSDSSRSRCDV
jgi:hypothetical protein